MMRAEEAARVLFLMTDLGLCLYIWRVLFHHQHSTIIHTILMETSNSNSESEEVKSETFYYGYDPEMETLTISGSGEEPITLSKAETDTWLFSITVPERGIIKRIHWEDLKFSVRTLVIQGEVESIGEDVFRGFSFLTKVEINSPIQSIGDNAFCGCDRLDLKFSVRTLVIQGEVESIGEDVFRGFSFLTKVEINSPIQSIGDNAFCGCDRLRSIKIPASVTSMGTSVFYGCDHLEEIESESLRYPAEDGVLFKVADDGKKILVRYPSNRKGKHYTIPNDVVEIEEYAFAKSRNLVSITIPKTVKRIGCCAFDTCRILRFITASWLRPPKVNSDIFCFFTKPSKIRLIVPYGMRSTYRAAPVWKKCMVVEWSYPERSASYRLRLRRNVRSKISYKPRCL